MSNKIQLLVRKLKTLDKRIVVWYKAMFMGYPYWRVIYGEETGVREGITEFKSKEKAKLFAKECKGRVIIDYNFIILIQIDSK